MCGICGIIGGSRRERIIPMTHAMHHRGPDDFGIVMEHGISLGMSRLAILDLSPAAHQPMWNTDQTICIVYNGEMYNFHEERKNLADKGHHFISQSDTEVVLRLYEQYGDDFLLRMRGMFGLAIYDRRRGPGHERILLARDHFGIKPLLYATTDNGIVFASEIKPILASGLVERKINTAALPLLMVKGSIPQPMTIIAGVSMLPPAHRMIVEDGKISRVEPYWNLAVNRRSELQSADYQDIVAEVRSALETSVRLQMVSDVPIGAFLSGGVDSSLMVAMMARQTSHRVKTFSVGFGAEGAGIDETEDAERIARFIGTDHTRVEISGAMVRDRIGHIASALDQPTVDGVNSYLVSLAARQGVTVAISGTGGDELFAGYPWFLNMYRVAQSGGSQNFALRYAQEYQVYGVNEAIGVLTQDIRAQIDADLFLNEYALRPDELPAAEPLERVSALCLRGYTQNQLLRDIDTVSMAHSLEVRVPFLDPVMADIALSLPLHAKLNPDTASLDPYAATYRQTGVKRVLIDIGRELLPPNMDVQLKRGFGMPFANWLRNDLRDVLEETLSYRSIVARGLFVPEEVTRLKNELLAGGGSWPHVWLPMMTELWCRTVLDQDHAFPNFLSESGGVFTHA